MTDEEQLPPDQNFTDDSVPSAESDVSVADDPNAGDDQRERYLRLAAEYDNYRKRTSRERQEAHVRGQADMLRELIDPLDDLGRFAHVDPATTDAKTVIDGMALVEKKLAKVLNTLGMEILNPVGAPFDPALHEAVMTEAAATPEEDHSVARVFQVGYVFNGQLLRPARVVVKQWNG
ncbi:MAG: Protein grpE [Gemmatimonadetes bacterium]|nr:Protein grpE [Gemmatimonadota bacterium]